MVALFSSRHWANVSKVPSSAEAPLGLEAGEMTIMARTKQTLLPAQERIERVRSARRYSYLVQVLYVNYI